MSGRDSLLCGFEARQLIFAYPMNLRINRNINMWSDIISDAIRLGIPDCVVFNSLILSEEFFRHRSSAGPVIPRDVVLMIALRFSVFYRQRSDVMNQLMLLRHCNLASSQLSQIVDAESELLAFCKCRVWCTQGNIFEDLHIIIDSVFMDFPQLEKLRDVSTSVGWLLVDSGFIKHTVSAASVTVAILACSIGILCKCWVIGNVTQCLLAAMPNQLMISDWRKEVDELTTRLLTYIVDYYLCRKALLR